MTRAALALAVALTLSGAARADFEIGSEGWAPVPKGGVSWDVLSATEAMPWVTPEGVTHLAPRFPKAVEALDNRPVAIAGYMVPLDDGDQVRHFALYASKVDCEMHLPPGPNGYVDVVADRPLPETHVPIVVRGTLHLVRARKGGVFYRMVDARVSPEIGARPLPASD